MLTPQFAVDKLGAVIGADKSAEFAAANLYSDLMHGRRVAVVGPADTTTGKGQGAFIESHDVVVRINAQWPVKPELVPDIGQRADVVYHCCTGHAPVAHLSVPEFANLRFVWLRSSQDAPSLTRLCREHGIPFGRHDDFKWDLRRRLGSSPTTGLIAIAHLLTTELKELYVTGFSFYSTRYYKGYAGKGARLRYWWRGAPRGIDRHDFELERKFFRSLCERDARIVPDAALKDLIATW